MAEKTYSLAEIAKHNTNKSVWFAIHNNVYDVTEFLNEVSGINYFVNPFWVGHIGLFLNPEKKFGLRD